MELPSLPTQNRKMVRLRCNYPVSCSINGRRFTAHVVDMGLEGLRLQVPLRIVAGADHDAGSSGAFKPERGQLIALRYEGPAICFEHDTIHGRIVWIRTRDDAREMGIVYAHPSGYLERSWVRHLLRVFDLDKISVADRRREVRIALRMPASISGCGEGISSATLRDIGAGGALLESAADLPLGTSIRIRLEGGEGIPVTCEGHVVRKSRVTRRDPWLVGVRFAGVCAGIRRLVTEQRSGQA